MESADTNPTPASATDGTTYNQPRGEDGVALSAPISHSLTSGCGGLFADALKETVGELRKGEEARISQSVHIELPRGSEH